MSDALLELRGLATHFRLDRHRTVHAVDGVDLCIAQNEILGLVGESGSGKSTLGKTVVGLVPRTRGEMLYRGQPLPQRYGTDEFRRYAREIQMIFQDPYGSLNPRMTAGDIVAEPLLLNGVASAAERRERVAGWFRRVGLSPDFMGRYAHEFSGGQRQRLGIARALVLEPKLVVCDEPISALDVSVQAQIVNLLEELRASLGLTLLFIAHDLSMVRYISDRMAVMYLGAVVELGPAESVYGRPLHPYTQALVASNPEPDPALERGRPPLLIQGEIPSPVNIGPGCRFASRCPHAVARCRSETPQLQAVEDRQVACHLFG